jgi:hypothetical protein
VRALLRDRAAARRMTVDDEAARVQVIIHD